MRTEISRLSILSGQIVAGLWQKSASTRIHRNGNLSCSRTGRRYVCLEDNRMQGGFLSFMTSKCSSCRAVALNPTSIIESSFL